MSAHHVLEQPEFLSEEEERRRKRLRKVQSFPKKLPSEDPILAALMSKRRCRGVGRPSIDSSSPVSPSDDPEETRPGREGFPNASGRFARVSEGRELSDDEAGNGAGSDGGVLSKAGATQEDIAWRDVMSVSLGSPGYEKGVLCGCRDHVYTPSKMINVNVV